MKRKDDAEAQFEEAKAFVEAEYFSREQKRLAKAQFELEWRTAIRIQSWWRMTMVRKCLGPYKKKKLAKLRELQEKKAATAAAAKASGGGGQQQQQQPQKLSTAQRPQQQKQSRRK